MICDAVVDWIPVFRYAIIIILNTFFLKHHCHDSCASSPAIQRIKYSKCCSMQSDFVPEWFAAYRDAFARRLLRQRGSDQLRRQLGIGRSLRFESCLRTRNVRRIEDAVNASTNAVLTLPPLGAHPLLWNAAACSCERCTLGFVARAAGGSVPAAIQHIARQGHAIWF